VAAAIAAGALTCSASVPALAATTGRSGGAAATRCAAATAASPLDQIGSAPCSGGTTAAQERDEAIFAGAGVLLFGVGALVYRRRRRDGVGPTSGSRQRPV
jgi:LPXTG-motif cell wall-anchored protein